MVARDIFFIFAWSWIAVAVLTFIILRFVSAPYGRHTRGGWGPTLPNHIGWIVMETTGLIILPTLFFAGPSIKTDIHYILLFAYIAHYLNRAWIFPFRIRTRGKRMPVAIMGSAIFFNVINTSLLGLALGWFADFPDNWITHPIFIIGAILFLAGAIINIDADNRLLALRRGTETGYKIPYGGLFKWISCPNLAGEMLEWCGYAIMSWNVAGLSFAVWTIANLLPRALDHHKWYQSKFPDYPRERTAVLPYIL